MTKLPGLNTEEDGRGMGASKRMHEYYKGCHIYSGADLNANTDCWVPKADISWHEGGNRHSRLLAGPDDRFHTKAEAESYAIQMARKWVDDRTQGKQP